MTQCALTVLTKLGHEPIRCRRVWEEDPKSGVCFSCHPRGREAYIEGGWCATFSPSMVDPRERMKKHKPFEAGWRRRHALSQIRQRPAAKPVDGHKPPPTETIDRLLARSVSPPPKN